MKKVFLASLVLTLFWSSSMSRGLAPYSPAQRPRASGKIYKWVDKNGQKHFTDDISSIPAEYRDQVEAGGGGRRGSRDAAAGRLGGTGANQRQVLDLFRIGASLFVDVELDGHQKSQFLVDTGATDTIISTELARALRLNLGNMGLVPLRSASGVFVAKLATLGSIRVGQTAVRGLDVFVYDTGHPGILGMSFLENFDFTMNAGRNQLVLSPPSQPPWASLFGGHTEDWWRRKFRSLRDQIEAINGYIPMARGLKDGEMEKGFSRSLQHYQRELRELQREAAAASVPYDWRE